MKMKVSSSLRTYDNNGYRMRAGCLCYKDESEKEVILVTSSRDTSVWVVPAGGVDPGESALEAAVREVHEEAGVLGEVGRYLGIFQDEARKTKTHMYSLVVKKMVSPLEAKERKWFKIKDAIMKLNHRPAQQSYITATVNKKTSPAVATTPATDSNVVHSNSNSNSIVDVSFLPGMLHAT